MNTRVPKQKRTIPRHIRYHLKTQPSSGKTIKAYCKEAGFSPWTFYNWRNRYGSRIASDTSTGKESLSSAEVSFTTLGALSLKETIRPLLDIQFSSRITIRVYPGTTAFELTPFLSMLVESKLPC